jgi:hypothetical protein
MPLESEPIARYPISKAIKSRAPSSPSSEDNPALAERSGPTGRRRRGRLGGRSPAGKELCACGGGEPHAAEGGVSVCGSVR